MALRAVAFLYPGGGSVLVHAALLTSSTVVVAIDVVGSEFAFSVTESTRTPLLRPRTGCVTALSLSQVVADIAQVDVQ